MRAFVCRNCGNALYFENSTCIACGTALGYSREERAIVGLNEAGTYLDPEGRQWWRCRNDRLSGCTWLCESENGLCFSCRLTRTRPSDADIAGLAAFPNAEHAKRRLIVELDELDLPITSRRDDPETGLAFDLLSSTHEPVTTGHHNGIITIDLAESDSVHREQMRRQLAEPYRTMLGHFRHEIGHYFDNVLVTGALRHRARELFGDERVDYSTSLERYYRSGPAPSWQGRFISAYATMHPFEDFAETFAHFLHITDTINTARAFGLTTVAPEAFTSFGELVNGVWIPLSIALNQINRSMGKDALYPFVLAPQVIEKLEFVASLTSRHEDSRS